MLAHHIMRQSARSFKQRGSKPLAENLGLPWKIGAGACAVGSVGALGYTLKHALYPENNHLSTITMWPSYVKQRVNGTFAYFLGGIGCTTLGAMGALRIPALMRMTGGNTMWSFIGCIAAMWGTGYLVQTTHFNGSPLGLKAMLYYFHMGVVGAIVAPIAVIGGEACLFAAGLTGAVMAGLSLTAMVAPSDTYLKTYGVVNAGIFLILGACVMSFFVNPMSMGGSAIGSVITFGGLGIFSLKGFSDIQRSVEHAKRPGHYDPINHAVHIGMDAINIFIRLAMLLGGNRKK